jgi:di/tricarboxylate transporter
VVIATIVLVAASGEFSELPTQPGYWHETDWEAVATSAIQIRWLSLTAGGVLAILAFEVFARIVYTRRLEAFLLLVLAFTSFFAFVYVYAIRTVTPYIFSMVIGGLVGALLRAAFSEKETA